MRKKLVPNLYVGDARDCVAADGEWTVIHACAGCSHRCGPGDMHVNLANSVTPDYTNGQFDGFLKFAKEQWATGKPMLIHSEDGRSRAPALALLFLAKVLYRISNADFDEAWVEFEKLVGEPFTPCEGLELFLRDHWRQLDLETYVEPRSETPMQREEVPQIEMPREPSAMRAIIEAQPLIHFAGFTQIQNKKRKWVNPVPNTLQRQIAEAYNWCQERQIPCRLIILKPRQVGCSTFCAELVYHHMRRWRSNVLVVSDTKKRAMTLWDMLQGVPSHDIYPWQSRITKANTEVIEVTFPDGEKGVVKNETAMDEKAGISATTQIIWWSEVAKYMRSAGRDHKVVQASMISLANVPESLGIMESTAEGSSGIFHEMFKGAVSLADRKAMKRDEYGNLVVGNGFISIFCAWHEFSDHALERTPENANYFREELNDAERRGVALYGWTPEQMAFRRLFLERECHNDERLYQQDFPEDAESAFLSSGRPRFNPGTLALMEKMARTMHDRAEIGVLEEHAGKFKFTPCDDGGTWLWVSEHPKIGCSYIAFIDPCTGAQAEGSPFPDAHGAGVWRAGYHEKNRWHPPRLVAMIHGENGVRFDDEVIAEKLKRIADWYGGCMIVPEVNKSGILNELQRIGAVIYQRERIDAMFAGRKLEIAGWETNTKTRPLLVNAYANYIREYKENDPSFEVFYLPLIQELKTLVMNNDKAEAKHGCRDDLVFGSALGLYNLELATPMAAPYGGGWMDGRPDPIAAMPGGIAAAAFS